MDLNKIKGRAQDLLKEHGDQIEKVTGKAEKFAKSKTQKHDGKIDKVTGKIRGLIADDDKPGSPPPASGPVDPA